MSKILKNVHEAAKGLHDAGIMDATTMRKFDAHFLKPTPKLSSGKIQKIRKMVNVSQPVFAKFLNVSPSTIKKWENGEKHPNGASLRLLQLVDHDGLEVFKSIQTR